MQSQSIIEHGKPLEAVEKALPEPKGSEILVRVNHCGVCHSDVHLQDGYFGLGGDKKLDITGAHKLPFTMGHEIEGTVAAVGTDATDVAVGDKRVVFPWIGCGDCAICDRGEEHLCNAPRALGVNVDGGYADHVLVPHPRYLLDHDGIADGLAATYMCSGLTAYGALKKVAPIAAGDTIAIIGLGGVGMMGLQFARALYPEARVMAVDIDALTRQAALDAGADDAFDPSEEDAAKALFKASGGGVQGAVDFVGADASMAFANRSVAKAGKLIVVGLFGGEFRTPIPMLPLRAITIQGSYVGSLTETEELMELVKAGKVAPIPVEKRPLDQAEATLKDLRNGAVVGRVVLAP